MAKGKEIQNGDDSTATTYQRKHVPIIIRTFSDDVTFSENSKITPEISY